jgi:hypothetical protein
MKAWIGGAIVILFLRDIQRLQVLIFQTRLTLVILVVQPPARLELLNARILVGFTLGEINAAMVVKKCILVYFII